jgi:hypothetical protein
MLKLMTTIRKTENQLALGRKEGLIGGPIHLGVGQEAIAGNYSGVIRDYGVRILDVNGDGLVDYLQCDTAGDAHHCQYY